MRSLTLIPSIFLFFYRSQSRSDSHTRDADPGGGEAAFLLSDWRAPLFLLGILK